MGISERTESKRSRNCGAVFVLFFLVMMQHEVQNVLPALFALAALQAGIPRAPVKPVVTNFFASHAGTIGILFLRSVEGKGFRLPKGFLMLEDDLWAKLSHLWKRQSSSWQHPQNPPQLWGSEVIGITTTANRITKSGLFSFKIIFPVQQPH